MNKENPSNFKCLLSRPVQGCVDLNISLEKKKELNDWLKKEIFKYEAETGDFSLRDKYKEKQKEAKIKQEREKLLIESLAKVFGGDGDYFIENQITTSMIDRDEDYLYNKKALQKVIEAAKERNVPFVYKEYKTKKGEFDYYQIIPVEVLDKKTMLPVCKEVAKNCQFEYKSIPNSLVMKDISIQRRKKAVYYGL